MTDFDRYIPPEAQVPQWIEIRTSSKPTCCKCFWPIKSLKCWYHTTHKPKQYMHDKCKREHDEHVATKEPIFASEAPSE